MRHLTLDVIQDEHQALSATLRSLSMRLAQARRQGTLPDFEVLRAMLFYVDEFPGRLHHSKESPWPFPRLREKAPELAAVLAKPDRDHATGESAIRDLEHALPGFEVPGESPRPAFETAVERCIGFHLERMATEENELLPAARRCSSEADRAEPDAAYRPGAEEQSVMRRWRRAPCAVRRWRCRQPIDSGRMTTLKALILAAGRGERLRPLTDHAPKPLLQVRGRPLIEWHLEALARAGVRDVVINTAWLEEQFPAALGDGSRWGQRLHYSTEGRDHGGALETAGGIAKAVPLLGDLFWVVSGDVFLPGFAFEADAARRFERSARDAHLWMVRNAPHHPGGDFHVDPQGLLRDTGPGERLTWASVGLFRSAMFEGIPPGTRLPLRPLLDKAINQGRLGGELWPGEWTDVGTAERLASLNLPV